MAKVEKLRRFVEIFVEKYPREHGLRGWWRQPLLATAPVDERFEILPRIAAPDHAQPIDLLPEAKSVIAFFIPFGPQLLRENSRGERPCRNWGLAYVETNQLIEALGPAIQDHLAQQGLRSALTPATHNFDPIKLTSRWSHKHLAHLCGLGRFGHNAQLITPAGCGGRLGSLVTEAELGDNPVIFSSEACLSKAGGDCLECTENCPAGALAEAGIDRQRCWDWLKDNLATSSDLRGLPNTTHVCGKCVAGVACSLENPVAV